MVYSWLEDNKEANDECSVLSEMSDFEHDEEEVNNGTDDSQEEVSDSESTNSVADDEEDCISSSTSPTNNSSYFTGKNRNVWSAACPAISRRRACNIRHKAKDPIDNAKSIQDKGEAFLCSIEKDMLKMVFESTNKYGESRKDNWTPVDMDEIKSIIGLLLVTGVYRSQYKSLQSVRSPGLSGLAIL